MRIVFRADASRPIGTGHVMRCLALAETLKKRGAETHFICRDLSGAIPEAVRSRGHALHRLPAPTAAATAGNGTVHAHWLEVAAVEDAAQTRAALERLGDVEWLVVDHYALDEAWERSQRGAVRAVAVIDDLADRAHDCDLLLDQTPAASDRYAALVPPNCRRLMGPTYALLRPEFTEWHHRTAPRAGRLRRLLVCFGGVDAANHTRRVIEALKRWQQPDLAVDVVAGLANPHVAELKEVCKGQPHLRLHVAPSNLVELMAVADFAIGAGGVMLWERACLGLPALAVVVADNQRAVIQTLSREGLIESLEVHEATPERYVQALQAWSAQPARLQDCSRRNHALVDGRGCDRAARALLPPTIALRRARSDDVRDLHAWRNAESVRRHTKNPDPIPWAAHERWFAQVLGDPRRDLLVAEHDGRPIGVLRYDVEADEVLVSIYLVPGQGGGGYGPALLLEGHRWLQANRAGVRHIRAEVLADNHASHRAFAEAGYRLRQSTYHFELSA